MTFGSRAFPVYLTLVSTLAMLPGAALAQGTLVLSASANGNVVTVDITITDNGGASDCGAFHLVRGTVFRDAPAPETICIPRVIGTTTTHQFVEVLPPARAYHYSIVGVSCIASCVCPWPVDPDAFNQAFGSPWGLGFHAYVNTAQPEETPVALGHIVSTPGPYPPYILEGCPGSGTWGALASPDAGDYIDTGDIVLVYGELFFDVQNGPLLQMLRVAPWLCDTPVAVERSTWGGIKATWQAEDR